MRQEADKKETKRRTCKESRLNACGERINMNLYVRSSKPILFGYEALKRVYAIY